MVDKVFTMRIDEELLEKIRVQADQNKRSIAKEIEYILQINYDLENIGKDQKFLEGKEQKISIDLEELASRMQNIEKTITDLSDRLSLLQKKRGVE